MSPVKGAKEELRRRSTRTIAHNPLIFPDDETLSKVHHTTPKALDNQDYIRAVAGGLGPVGSAAVRVTFLHRHRGLTPYLLLAPGAGLARDLLPRPARLPRLPVAAVGRRSPATSSRGSSRTSRDAIRLPRAADPLVPLRGDRDGRLRSCSLPARRTGSPSAAGRWRNLFLLSIVAPFFVTYLVRTLAWLNILADEGPVVGVAARASTCSARTSGCSPRRSPSSPASPTTSSPSWRCRSTCRSSRSTRGCSRRRRTSTRARTQAFLRVTLPLSAPGIVAGTLLTFIPAAGDFINAELLGTPKQQMIGNVIQAKFLELARLPDRRRALVHPDGADPRRAARLRPGRRHGEADRMTSRRRVLGSQARAGVALRRGTR